MTTPAARQPAGIPVGGQFASTSHSEPNVSLESSEPRTAAGILATNTDFVTLTYIERDDKLTEDQIDMALAGQWNDVENAVDDVFRDHADEVARETAEREVNEAFEEGKFDREWDELDYDEQDDAVQAIRDRDDSTPVKDLLRNTPDQLMRTSLGNPTTKLQGSGAALGSQLDNGGFEARQKAISDLLTEAGMDTSSEEVQTEIKALVNEGPYDWHEGVKLDLIFHGPVEDAVCRPLSDEESSGQKVLTFATPQVLLIDPWNGSGYEATFPAPITRTLDRPEEGEEPADTARVYLDSNASGYSWDAVCGLNKGAYRQWAPTASWTN